MDANLEKKSVKMGLKKPSEEAQFGGDGLIIYLCKELKISETMLAALLDVTSRSLDNWKNSSYVDLSGKAKRLRALYEFVTLATGKGVRSSELLSLLNETLDPQNQNGHSPLFYIVENPESSMFQDFSNLAINNFLKQS